MQERGKGANQEISFDDLDEVLAGIERRCERFDIGFKVFGVDEIPICQLAFREGRDRRAIELWDKDDVVELFKQPFERYVYLANLEAICNYEDGEIEAVVHPAGNVPPVELYRRLFGVEFRSFDPVDATLVVSPLDEGGASLEIGPPSKVFLSMNDTTGSKALTLKFRGVPVKTNDDAIAYLDKVGGSLLFQLELVAGIALMVRRKRLPRRRARASHIVKPDLEFPVREFDQAPLSLYWYGRSAAGMPLLQYLAYYQVIEFYFPIYSQSEAHRKVKSVLRNPAFRGERDADISKLLHAIHVTRSGAFGDERSQLKATIEECVDVDEIRAYIESDAERQGFFSSKSKLGCHRFNISNPDFDVRSDVSKRIYEIRCKIVHTKTDYRDADVELLLPFSKEADLLQFDIDLIQYVAQQVLIAGSRAI